MNRRDFAKALAGVPLLGLLVKVPKAEGGYIDRVVPYPFFPDYHYIAPSDAGEDVFEAAYADLRSGAVQQPALELRASAEGQPSFSITVDGVDISEHVESWFVFRDVGYGDYWPNGDPFRASESQARMMYEGSSYRVCHWVDGKWIIADWSK